MFTDDISISQIPCSLASIHNGMVCKKYMLTTPGEKAKYDDYRLEMIRNINIIINILRYLKKDDISLPFSPGVNIGVFNKYLKYKQKYLNLKKLL